MELFLDVALSFPVVIFSFLLCVAILYWCVAALGLVEIDVLDFDVDLEAGGEMAGLMMKFGLTGVPLTLILTLLFFFAWIITYFVELLLLHSMPLGLLRYPLGAVVAVAAVFLAVPITSILTRPLRPLFDNLSKASTSRSMLGRTAIVRSGRVTTTTGEAILDDGGAGLILRIRADESLGLKRNDRVVILEYIEVENAYRVITEEEFNGN